MSKQIVIGSSKSMKFVYQTESQPIYTDQSYSECVLCVFLQDFTKHMDSKIAPKTQAILIIDMLFYMNIMLACHIARSNRIFYALSS